VRDKGYVVVEATPDDFAARAAVAACGSVVDLRAQHPRLFARPYLRLQRLELLGWAEELENGTWRVTNEWLMGERAGSVRR
jgi:hypothetical protein